MSKVAKAVGAVVVGFTALVIGPFNPALGIALMKFSNLLLVGAALDVAIQNVTSTPGTKRTPLDVEYSDTTSPGRIIYGKVKTSGMNVIPPWKSGAKKRYLHQVLAPACHEVHDYGSVFFNKEEITSIGAVSGTVDDGAVGAGMYEDAAWIRRYKGTDSQTADFILNNAFTQWTSNHRGRGIPYVAIQYDLDNEDAYEHGKPEVTFIILGKRCYDPRLDTAPGANPTDAAYITYTTNPALCTCDYILESDLGLGEVPESMDWDSVVAAANICDEDVAIPGGTQKRYTCNVMLEVALTEEDRRQNIRILAGAMMGAADFRGGEWRLHAGAASDSSFALVDHDLRGRVSVRTEIPTDQKANRIRGQFVDRDRNYQAQEYEPRGDPAYELEDGNGGAERLEREVHFPTCDNNNEAQRNAIITLKRTRRRILITGVWSFAAFPIRLWDTGTITIEAEGIVDQKVRCIAWQYLQEGKIEASFLEELDSDWNTPVSGDYLVPGVGVGPPPGSSDPIDIPSFSIVGIVDGVRINAQVPVGWIPRHDSFRVYAHTSPSPFSSATLMATSNGTQITVKLADTTNRYWWLTHARQLHGLSESDPTPAGDGVQCAALALTDLFHASVTPATHNKLLRNTGSGTTSQTSTVTPVKGTAPYTYAWTRTSGSTKISVIASTSATTGFSASGLADDEVVNATFRCRVTDNTAATFDVFVKVTFRRDDQAYL